MKFFFFARNFLDQEISRFLAALSVAATLAILAGCGSGSTATTPATPLVAGGNTILLAVSNPQIPSAGATTIDVTATLLSASGQTIAGQALTLSKAAAETVFFSALSGAVTDANGQVTAKLNNLIDKNNRTVTITATAGAATAQIPVQVTGSTVTISAGTNLPDDGTSPLTLTITAKDSGGNLVLGTPVTVTPSGTGSVTLTPASGTSDPVTGQLAVIVTGVTAGTVTVTARALGATTATNFTVSSSAATFAIDQTTNGAVITPNPTLVTMQIGDSLVVRVNAPAPAANVQFATTLGIWSNGLTSIVAPVVAGKATATLTTNQAGLANVQAFDTAATSNNDTVAVSMTAVTATSITLQATPSVVAKSVGTTTGVSTLIATVKDAAGQPVGNAPVAFSIINPTGGGESVTPVVVFSASIATLNLALGEARTTFTSGSLSSAQTGVRVRASVLGTAVATEAIGTDVTSSGPDVAVVIGGTAGSVAFGSATVLAISDNGANYVQAMSVLVADANGNPAPQGTVVNLSAWPIAWSTGAACSPNLDTATTGTFLNEDVNENLILDPGEDGARLYYATGTNMVSRVTAVGPPVVVVTFTAGAGSIDGIATPPSSAAGIVPGTVTTDVNGVANFTLTYGKTSALWITTRLRARTVVQGTEAVSEIQFRLLALESDLNPCRLLNSPYFF